VGVHEAAKLSQEFEGEKEEKRLSRSAEDTVLATNDKLPSQTYLLTNADCHCISKNQPAALFLLPSFHS
jgi:hypothetical protein